MFTTELPAWVEPAPVEPGSIDPLGFLAPSENIADQLLPGVTVATIRARYLSFLCWAIRMTENDPRAIDRWEVALSISEHLRHRGKNCVYRGSLLLQQKALSGGDQTPRRLLVQTTRLVYTGLLRSCGFADQKGSLSQLGERIADEYGRTMPRSIPKTVSKCFVMPCLSEIRRRERSLLFRGFIEAGDEAEKRRQTLREIGMRVITSMRKNGAAWLLTQYLRKPDKHSSEPTRLLHAAARMELHALPLTRLFLYLYQHKGRISAKLPTASSFRPYRVRESPAEFLADVAAHLRKGNVLGESPQSLKLSPLITEVLRRHHEAKPEAPWVDDAWRVLRPGLQPQQLPGVHGYRLTAFASLVHDLQEH